MIGRFATRAMRTTTATIVWQSKAQRTYKAPLEINFCVSVTCRDYNACKGKRQNTCWKMYVAALYTMPRLIPSLLFVEHYSSPVRKRHARHWCDRPFLRTWPITDPQTTLSARANIQFHYYKNQQSSQPTNENLPTRTVSKPPIQTNISELHTTLLTGRISMPCIPTQHTRTHFKSRTRRTHEQLQRYAPLVDVCGQRSSECRHESYVLPRENERHVCPQAEERVVLLSLLRGRDLSSIDQRGYGRWNRTWWQNDKCTACHAFCITHRQSSNLSQ